ncbi:MAG: hypothetical protein ACFFF9_03830 [Candidatus Thorarchaeota archaeon]
MVSIVLKYTWILHFLVTIFFGVALFVVPDVFFGSMGWPVEIAMDRSFGSMFIALAIISLLAFREESFDRVEILVILEILLTLLGLVASLWNMLTMTLPVVGWAFTGLYALFFILFLYSYMTK